LTGEFPVLFELNPALARLHWTPEPYQILKYRNPSYLNSLWLGTFWNVFLLPTRLWVEVVLACIHDGLGEALLGLLSLVVSMVIRFAFGIAGFARGVDLPIETLLHCRVLDEIEAVAEIKAGTAVLVRSV
jgi:hypothetical protein